jgi:hypothetical protein
MFSVQTIDFLALYAGLEHTRLLRSSPPYQPLSILIRQTAVVYIFYVLTQLVPLVEIRMVLAAGRCLLKDWHLVQNL